MANVHDSGDARLLHPSQEAGAHDSFSPTEEEANAGVGGSGARTEPPRSADCSALFEALAKAQGQIQDPVKDAANPFFNSRYVTLSAVRDAIQGPLSANGLCVVQLPWCSDGNDYIITRLGHKSGQFVESWMPLDAQRGPNNMQAKGSAITYARRYALMAMVGIAPDDDDGEQAVGRTPPPAPTAAPPPPPEPAKAKKVAKKDQISDETYSQLTTMVKAAQPELSDVEADKFLLWAFNAKYYRDKPATAWDMVNAKHAASLSIALRDPGTMTQALTKWKANA